jgi:signal transduction histidine kinase
MVATDLTERNKRDRIIADERKRLFDVLEALPAMICLLTPDYHVAFANRSFREKFGESYGRRCYEYCFHRTEPCDFCESYEVLKTGKPHHWEVEGSDGSVISAYDFPFTDVDGSPLILEMDIDITESRRNEAELAKYRQHLEELVREQTSQLMDANAQLQADIDERKRTEAALRESERRYSALFANKINAMAQCRIITDEQGRPIDYWILRINEAYEKMIGIKKADIEGRRVKEVFPGVENYGFDYIGVLGKVAIGGGEISSEACLEATGQYLSLYAYSPVPGEFIAMFSDITERKRAEQALLRSEKLASVGRMASTIAHEINNPLETIGNVVYLALNDPGISQVAKSYLDVAVQELDRVNHITKQTLAFHRGTSTPTLIDLRENIEGVVKLFAPRLASREVSIAKRYADVGRIRAFGGEIQQVISNLLSNSMDATPVRGRIELRLSRTSDDGSQKLRFTVADTGSGIAPERLAKVFEPFFTTKEMYGTGLGLWVTKQIVEKHGATIRVRSKLGRGTVFSIVFPVAEVAKAL